MIFFLFFLFKIFCNARGIRFKYFKYDSGPYFEISVNLRKDIIS